MNNKFQRTLAVVAGIFGLCTALTAQANSDYPSRVVNFMTPTAAGGGTDLIARVLGENVNPHLGQSIIVTNKPGAGGVVGTQSMLREKNDGYTFLVTANSNQLIVPWIYSGATFDPIKDFEPVAFVGSMPFVLTVNPDFPANNLPEFLEELKRHPEKYQYASAGSGTLNHLIPEMLKQQAGVEMEHIPYRGAAPAMTDVIGKQVPIFFGSLPSVIENVRAGHLKPLAVTSATRSPALPDVPAIAEFIPDFDTNLWVAVYAPKGTAPEVIAKMSTSIEKAMKEPKLVESYRLMGMSADFEDANSLMQRQEQEYQLWREIVEKGNIKAD